MKVEYMSIKTPIINEETDLLRILVDSIQSRKLNPDHSVLKSGDLLVVASKVVAMVQGRVVDFSSITPSIKAKNLAEQSNLPPQFVQIVLDESEEVIGVVNGALLTFRKGDVQANAGIDKSNVGKNKAILLPENSDKFALDFKLELERELKIENVSVMIVDSCTRPLRRGTLGMALGTSGFPAIVDDRGLNDLFGYKMEITYRAVADNVASGANILMGESSESTPFVIVRGLSNLIQENKWNERKIEDLRVNPNECLFFSNFKYKNLKED